MGDNKSILSNPLIYSDFPDPDVILVDGTYYMISTTMNYYPGGAILRSYDLINWEFAGRVFDELGGLPCEKLVGDMNSYRKGMWAASIKYHDGLFYVFFTAFETESSFIFTSDRVDGKWTKHVIPEICHDAGLLFDDGAKQEIFEQLDKSYISGITFSGGDPLHPANRVDVRNLISEIKEKYPNKTIWLYTGDVWENIYHYPMMKDIDVVVDGEFKYELLDVNLMWKGSSNQRVVDVQKTLKQTDPTAVIPHCRDYYK